MKKLALILIISAIIAHFATIILIPHIVMLGYYVKMKHMGVEANRIYHAPLINASMREVVLPSPDLLYSYCLYDVSSAAVLVTAEIPENTYWSVSFYDSATNNFFTLNDSSVKREARILLVKDLSQAKNLNATIVVAKSEKGLILFRIFIPNESILPYLERVRQNSSCRAI